MKVFAPLAVAAGVLGLWLVSASDITEQAYAQSSAASAKSVEAPADSDAKPARKKPAGRLPNNYGKLDLSGEQRTKIYAIQAQYDEQLDALMVQIESLKTKRDSEIADILTADQKSRLTRILEEVAARKKARKSAREKAKTVAGSSE